MPERPSTGDELRGVDGGGGGGRSGGGGKSMPEQSTTTHRSKARDIPVHTIFLYMCE